MSTYLEKFNEYKALNAKAEKNATVFFGADWLSEIPISELVNDYGLAAAVYNRSLKGLKIEDAEKVMDALVCTLHPAKVFINLGENDAGKQDFDPEAFAEKYEWLLYTLHAKCNPEIYILSVNDGSYDHINAVLRKLAENYGCAYIDTQDCRTSFLHFFAKVRFFLRSQPITFCEAMNL